MKIRKGDNVLIVSGKDKGKKAKVLRNFPSDGLVLVEGINVKKTHKKPKRQGEKGQIIEVAFPIKVSKVQIFCPKCDKPSRVGYQIADGNKKRICRKCQGEF